MKALEESPGDILLIHDHIIAMKAAGYDLPALTLQEIFRMVRHGVDLRISARCVKPWNPHWEISHHFLLLEVIRFKGVTISSVYAVNSNGY